MENALHAPSPGHGMLAFIRSLTLSVEAARPLVGTPQANVLGGLPAAGSSRR